MIMYKFLDIECKIDFNNFLSIDSITGRLYKKDFNSFSDLYEHIDLNLNDITHILFDDYEYYLNHGKLHNLYGPAYIKYSTTSECYTNSFAVYKFYIDGKLVYDSINDINKGCNKIEWFKTKEIFFYKKLNNYSDIDIIPSNYHRKKRRNRL